MMTNQLQSPERRQFLGTAASGVGIALLSPLARGVTIEDNPEKILFHTDFTTDEPLPKMAGFELVQTAGAEGRCALGEVAKPNTHKTISIPLENVATHKCRLRIRLRSDHGSRCAIWLRSDKGRRRIGNVSRLPQKWQKMNFEFDTNAAEAKVTLEIVTPSSWGGSPPGKVWIDEIHLRGKANPEVPPYAAGTAEDFPVIAADGRGVVRLAMLNRKDGARQIDVFQLDGEQRELVASFPEQEATGLDRPALVGTAAGCLLVYGLEQRDNWRLKAIWLDENNKTCGSYIFSSPGRVNILPSLAWRNGRALAVWEASVNSRRGIWGASLTAQGAEGIKQISAVEFDSNNPDVSFMENGEAVAVWDSFRDGKSNLFLARRQNGSWGKERQLTSAPRLERHARIASRGNEIWLSWQIQCFNRFQISGIRDQRIAVGRLTPNGLEMPHEMFSAISPKNRFLVCPEICFDPEGRLWLTARESMGLHHGWLPLAWCYSGKTWSPAFTLWPDQGRQRAVNLVWKGNGAAVAAVQRDDLPKGWNQQGIRPDWQYQNEIVAFNANRIPPASPLQTVKTEIPDFPNSPALRMAASSARLPRQNTRIDNQELSLFWGDFHEHSDISVCQRRTNPPMHDLYANLRDMEMLDFAAVCDHGYNFDRPQWAFNGEQVRQHFEEKRFVTFLAEEWTSDHLQYKEKRGYRKYGHRNHIFLDPHHPQFYDSRDGDIPPRKLWRQLGNTEFIAIPHQLADTGNCPTDWREIDEKHQPVAEIFQTRESYEYLGCPRQAKRAQKSRGHFIQDAWEQGVIIGVIASPDHGGGRGKIGVWAPELTRESIFAAIRARHTFGTSGTKISLLFRHGEHLMGSKLPTPSTNPEFHFEATALQPIREVVIFRNNQIAHRLEPGTKTLKFDWRDPVTPAGERSWYYARVHCADDELAWSSPIWFLG